MEEISKETDGRKAYQELHFVGDQEVFEVNNSFLCLESKSEVWAGGDGKIRIWEFKCVDDTMEKSSFKYSRDIELRSKLPQDVTQSKDLFVVKMKEQSGKIWMACQKWILVMSEEGKIITVLSGHTKKVTEMEFYRNHMWSVCEGGVIRVWAIFEKGMPCVKELTSGNELKMFTIVNVGKEMWTSGFSTLIEVWDAKEMKYKRNIETEHKDSIGAMFKKENQVFAVSWDGTVSVWS